MDQLPNLFFPQINKDIQLPKETNSNNLAHETQVDLREDQFYWKRYGRWFEFNLAWSAVQLNEINLDEVTFESIDADNYVLEEDISLKCELVSLSNVNSIICIEFQIKGNINR